MINLEKNTTILITDVNSRKGFDVYNVFKQVASQKCLLASSVDVKLQLPLVYLQKINLLRVDNYIHFEKDLIQICDDVQNKKIIYVPISDTVNQLFYTFLNNQPLYAKQFLYSMPEHNSYETTLNKKLFQNYCEQHNFSVPQSYSFLDVKAGNCTFPIIVKPAVGAGSVGIKRIQQVSESTILNELNEADYVVQQIIGNSNAVEGAFFLCHKGEVISYYSHSRIRTYPAVGGVTVFSKSSYNLQLKKLGAEVLKSLNWSGFAMVEFLYNPLTNDYTIIEINPRTWGSFMLSQFCGANFAINYINLSVGLPVIEPNYTEKYIRWLYPFDIINYVKSKFALKGFWKFDTKNTCYITATYASIYSTITFMLYFTFNFSSVKRLFQKMYGK